MFMKKIFLSAITTCALAILAACSSADGFKAASLGGGAKAGQDYVTGLSPSAAARQYFARIGTKAPIETLTKANAARSKSGVRFVDNDGILIPAGVTIQFTNKGYCLDPKLPAPVADEEYQLVPVSALIPTELQGIYSNLVRKAAAGDTNVKNNMQRLVWALRTAGTDASYANNLSATQKSILDSCSSRPGEFESVHNGAKATSMLMDKVWGLADSIGSVRVAGRSYRASDFRSVASLENAVGSHLNNLLLQGKNLPIQRTGFNFGELQPGIYTDVRGAGFLAFTAKIANATNQDFIFYPGNYVGQVGSGSALSALSSSNNTRRQRVSMGPVERIIVFPSLSTETPGGVALGWTKYNYTFKYCWTKGGGTETLKVTPERDWKRGITTGVASVINARTFTGKNGTTINLTEEILRESTRAHEENGHKALAEKKGPMFILASAYSPELSDLDEFYAMRKGARKMIELLKKTGVGKNVNVEALVDEFMESNSQLNEDTGSVRGRIWKKYKDKDDSVIDMLIDHYLDNATEKFMRHKEREYMGVENGTTICRDAKVSTNN